MSSSKVAIVDYGVGNLLSVERALRSSSVTAFVSSNLDELEDSSHIVLPGVGAFGRAMSLLRERHLDTFLKSYERTGRPLLGICLGMQLLFQTSEEFGQWEGLGFIDGRVVPIDGGQLGSGEVKVPHVGWSLIEPQGEARLLRSSQDKSVNARPSFYFVHSFRALPSETAVTKGICRYGKIEIPAIVERGNVYGCQFHPEKSGPLGLELLRNFCAL